MNPFTKILKKFSILLLIIALAECAPAAPSGLTSDGGLNTESGGITSGTSSTDSTSDGSSGSSTTNNSPTVGSIPPPAAKVDVSRIIAAAPATDGYVPVVGQASSATAGNTIVVSTSEIETATASNLTPPLKVRGGWGALFPSAYADSTTTPLMELCDQAGVACCTAQTDGSFECYVEANSSSTIYVSQTTDGTDVSANEETTPNLNLLYLAKAPGDTKVIDDSLYTITNGLAVKTNYDATNGWQVGGTHQTNYESFTTSGTQLAYGDYDSLVGAMDSTHGVQLLSPSGDTFVDSGETGTDTSATSYTVLKPINDILYYGYEQTSSTEAHLSFATTEDLNDPNSHKTIYIIGGKNRVDDFDSTGTLIHHTKTLAYDSTQVATVSQTVVAFEDGTNIRMRLISNDGFTAPDRLDGNIWKTTSQVGIRDLIIYHNDGVQNINFAVLDNVNSKVYLGRYNTNTGRRFLGDANTVSVGTNPVGMVYSATSGKLYVLNQGDKSVSVIPLVNSALPVRSPTVEATIDLSNFAEGKTINYNPSTILLSSDKKQLLVGDATTKALMVVDVAAYE